MPRSSGEPTLFNSVIRSGSFTFLQAYFQPETIAIAVLKDSKNRRSRIPILQFHGLEPEHFGVFEDFRFSAPVIGKTDPREIHESALFILPLLVLCLFTAAVLVGPFLSTFPRRNPSCAGLGRDPLSLSTSAWRPPSRPSLLALILGVPTGYFLARTTFPGKQILDTFLDLPLVIPPLVAGVGLLFLFGRGMLGGTLEEWGIHILFTPWGAVLAQSFVACPIVMRTSRAAFERSGYRYEWAAATLGLRPSRVFFQVSLPLARQGILAGTILGWTRAMGEFGATLMVAGRHPF